MWQSKSIISLLTLISIYTASAQLHGQTPFAKASQVDQAVEAEMKRQNLVGVAIGIIWDGKIVYTKGYGYSNLEQQTKATDDSIFNWASNSKPVMGIAAMQLVQNGKLDLDKPISTYLSDLPPHMGAVTTRQLLCHQSGIPHYFNGKVIPSGQTVEPSEETDPAKAIHRFIKSPLIFEPGEKTAYSSHAYVLLSAVVQAAGQQPIEKQLLERIGKPLDLKTFQLDLPYKQQPNWVTAYRVSGGKPAPVNDVAHSWKHGAGGYKSNVKDFVRFALALSNSELIDKATTKKMWTNQTTTNGNKTTYGLGVVVQGEGDWIKVSHNGSQDETKTRMVLYPNQRTGVVVMCNTQHCNPGQISTAIYTAINKN